MRHGEKQLLLKGNQVKFLSRPATVIVSNILFHATALGVGRHSDAT